MARSSCTQSRIQADFSCMQARALSMQPSFGLPDGLKPPKGCIMSDSSKVFTHTTPASITRTQPSAALRSRVQTQ